MSWISVEDRLPEKDKSVLLLVSDKITQGFLFEDFEFNEMSMQNTWYKGFWSEFSEDALEWVDVTHWQPLPKPPKGE